MKKVKYLLLFLVLLFTRVFAQNSYKSAMNNILAGDFRYFDNYYESQFDPIKAKKYEAKGIIYKDSVLYMNGAKILKSESLYISNKIRKYLIYNGYMPNINFNLDLLADNNKKEKALNSNIRIDEIKIIDSRIGEIDFRDTLTFRKAFTLFNTKVTKDVRFINASFNGRVDFRRSRFDSLFSIENSSFRDEVVFRDARFNYAVFFTGIDFGKTVRFPRVSFKNKVEFARVIFHDTIDFSWTQFANAIDLRRCDFRNVKVVYLENIAYPEGKLFVDWEQLKSVNGEDRIRLSMASKTDKWDNYKRLALIYENLRDDFLAQGKTRDADNVMYELAVRKNKLVGNFKSDLYGFFLGYGYRPWRFLLLLILPIILIWAFVYYFFYYGNVIRIVNPDCKQVNNIAKLWHVIFFSATVLLSFKFKNDWLVEAPGNAPGKNNFLIAISIQWLMGIILYVLFGLYVLSSQFNFVKGLFGI